MPRDCTGVTPSSIYGSARDRGSVALPAGGFLLAVDYEWGGGYVVAGRHCKGDRPLAVVVGLAAVEQTHTWLIPPPHAQQMGCAVPALDVGVLSFQDLRISDPHRVSARQRSCVDGRGWCSVQGEGSEVCEGNVLCVDFNSSSRVGGRLCRLLRLWLVCECLLRLLL